MRKISGFGFILAAIAVITFSIWLSENECNL